MSGFRFAGWPLGLWTTRKAFSGAITAGLTSGLAGQLSTRVNGVPQ